MTTSYRVSDGALRDLSPEQFQALAPNKRADLRPYVIDAQPTPSATQYVESGPVNVTYTEARKTWLLLDKSAEQVERETEVAQAKAVLVALKNGTGTSAERLARIERVLFRVAKDLLG